jgi:hypothetical protein
MTTKKRIEATLSLITEAETKAIKTKLAQIKEKVTSLEYAQGYNMDENNYVADFLEQELAALKETHEGRK